MEEVSISKHTAILLISDFVPKITLTVQWGGDALEDFEAKERLFVYNYWRGNYMIYGRGAYIRLNLFRYKN